jgi:hypothetical protein
MDTVTIIISVILGLLGIFFIYWGLRAVDRKQTTIGSEWYPDLTLKGKAAVLVGWCFIFLGIVEEIVVLILVFAH